jgi:hypothetical protein
MLFQHSCSCNWHLKKVKNKCDFDTETITVHDTIKVPEVHRDSMFFYNQKDTVIITKDNLEIKYFYSNDSVYIDGRCKEKTIIKERTVTINKYKQNPTWYWWIIGILVGLLLLKRFKLL